MTQASKYCLFSKENGDVLIWINDSITMHEKNSGKWRPYSIWLIFLWKEKRGNHRHTFLSARQEKVHLQLNTMGNCWIPLATVRKCQNSGCVGATFLLCKLNVNDLVLAASFLVLSILNTPGGSFLFSRKCIRRLWDLSYFFRLIPLF